MSKLLLLLVFSITMFVPAFSKIYLAIIASIVIGLFYLHKLVALALLVYTILKIHKEYKNGKN